jgi:ATP-binding cassette, subfamily B, bacterial HlyB/CyaB
MTGRANDNFDSGLACLVLLLRFNGVAAEPDQIGHRLGGAVVGPTEMLGCARALGLKARAVSKDWSRLAATALPAIAECRDGTQS